MMWVSTIKKYHECDLLALRAIWTTKYLRSTFFI